MWAEQEAGKEPRERSGSAGRKRSARGRGGRAGAGLGPPRIVQRLAGAAGPGPVWFPGMVSKGLLRLISSVNRRRMKLLLGIALLAYAACECARGGREPIHSRAAGSGRCGRPSGGLCRAGSRVPASTRLHLCSGAGGCLACSPPPRRPGVRSGDRWRGLCPGRGGHVPRPNRRHCGLDRPRCPRQLVLA